MGYLKRLTLKNWHFGTRINSILTFLFVLFISHSITAQVSFKLGNDLLQNNEVNTQVNMAISDLNGDYRDDIVRLDQRTMLVADFQAIPGQMLQHRSLFDVGGNGEWTINVGDLNNDYLPDVITAGFYNGASVIMNNGGTSNFELVQTTINNYYAQGSNLVDINNDGFLDYFVCNDDALSKIFINDGTGRMVDESDMIDMVTVPMSENSGNYASLWADVDGDNDMDLFLVKCRLGATELDDPTRINVLFINENGSFVESGEAFGLKNGEQSWSADFGDIDNDGDLDLIIGHHEAPIQLMENINNQGYQEIPFFAGADIEELVFQTIFEDFDNDGFLDIVVAGQSDSYILYNNGDKSFRISDEPFGGITALSCTTGDINSDGFIDVVTSYASAIGGGSTASDNLYVNEGNDNHFVTFALRGVQSNSSGIGAKVEIEGPWGSQMRFVKSGISYTVQNSLIQRFGLGQSTSITNVKVTWPSGTIDQFSNITADKNYVITEGSCINELVDLEYDGDLSLCPGASVDLFVTGSSNVVWNTGATNQTLTADAAGFYHAAMQLNGCPTFSNTVWVDQNGGINPTFDVEEDLAICLGDNLEVNIASTFNNSDISWSNGSQNPTTTYTEAGDIWVSIESTCGIYYSDTINLEISDPTIPAFDTIVYNTDPVELHADGDSISWYSDMAGMDLVATGNSFTTGQIMDDIYYYAKNLIGVAAKSFEGGLSLMSVPPDNLYSDDGVNGGLWFTVDRPAVLKSVAIETDKIGIRKINIFNMNVFVDSRIVDITEVGPQRIELNFDLEPDIEYLIATEIQTNLDELGHEGCRFSRKDFGITYPILIGDIVTINASQFGFGYYHHFFEWEVSERQDFCESELVPYFIDLEPSNTNDISVDQINVYPNPFDHQLTIDSDLDIEAINVSTLSGQRVEGFNSNQRNFNTEDLAPGIYIIEIQTSTGNFVTKLFKE